MREGIGFDAMGDGGTVFGVEEIALDPFPGFLPTDPGV